MPKNTGQNMPDSDPRLWYDMNCSVCVVHTGFYSYGNSSLIMENKDEDVSYFSAIILQHVSSSLLYLGVVLC